MMRGLLLLLLAAFLTALPAEPVLADWKLVEGGRTTTIGKTSMRVTPTGDWNRTDAADFAEHWTRDGILLNDVLIVAGMPEGWTLYEASDEEERPLPELSAQLDIIEIPEFFEKSTRLALNTPVFTITSVEPATMSGHAAVKFTFDYALPDSPLNRRGVAMGTMVEGKLYLIAFDGPATYFFDRDRAEVEAIMASATF
ncbi:MAG: DUF3012 domain-containing protein [Porphyrobacter sp.]|jgi:hypothetical protein|nr:DUF3012 domain-containing protein [Porphyrobacter sp.]